MSYVIGRNNIALIYNGKLMGNPLPSYTLRFQFSDPSYDPTTVESWLGPNGQIWTWLYGSTWTKVQGVAENQWDWEYDDPDWFSAFRYAFRDSDNEVQVIAGNTKGITDMAELFEGCTSLTSCCWLDTSIVTRMSEMFVGCEGLSYIPTFDTHNVTSMYAMLMACTGITRIPSFDTSKVTNMRQFCSQCHSLSDVPMLDTHLVTDMSGMFADCWALTTVPLFDTSNVTTMAGMFNMQLAQALPEHIPELRTIPLFNTQNVTTMETMCYNCRMLKYVPLFNTGKVVNMNYAFWNCRNVESGALALYNQASSQATPPTSHTQTFRSCGYDTTTGYAEYTQIPSDWK
jgi:surface protein